MNIVIFYLVKFKGIYICMLHSFFLPRNAKKKKHFKPHSTSINVFFDTSLENKNFFFSKKNSVKIDIYIKKWRNECLARECQSSLFFVCIGVFSNFRLLRQRGRRGCNQAPAFFFKSVKKNPTVSTTPQPPQSSLTQTPQVYVYI